MADRPCSNIMNHQQRPFLRKNGKQKIGESRVRYCELSNRTGYSTCRRVWMFDKIYIDKIKLQDEQKLRGS